MNNRREKIARAIAGTDPDWWDRLKEADAILALFADEIRGAERWREVCYDWGYGVHWGFSQFEDCVSSRMTDAEQQTAIDAAKGAG